MGQKEKIRTEDSQKLHVGVDAGSVSINCIVVNERRAVVFEAPYGRHLGRVDEGVLALVRGLYERFGEEAIRSVSFTGNQSVTGTTFPFFIATIRYAVGRIRLLGE